MVSHGGACLSSSTREAETGAFLWVLGQPGLHGEFHISQSYMVRETLSQKQNNKTNTPNSHQFISPVSQDPTQFIVDTQYPLERRHRKEKRLAVTVASRFMSELWSQKGLLVIPSGFYCHCPWRLGVVGHKVGVEREVDFGHHQLHSACSIQFRKISNVTLRG